MPLQPAYARAGASVNRSSRWSLSRLWSLSSLWPEPPVQPEPVRVEVLHIDEQGEFYRTSVLPV